jgi:hypothetical protein
MSRTPTKEKMVSMAEAGNDRYSFFLLILRIFSLVAIKEER